MTDSFKEQLEIFVFLKDDARGADIDQLERAFSASQYVKDFKYVTKQEAAEQYKREIGDDFVEFIGENPLPNHFIVRVKADYIDIYNLEKISQVVGKNIAVSEVSYDKVEVANVNKNIRKISYIFLAVCLVFLVFCLTSISLSIRNYVWSKKIIIKTMLFVGATRSFVIRPLIVRNMVLSAVASSIACVGVYLCLYFFDKYYGEAMIMKNKMNIAIVFFCIYSIGLLMSWVITQTTARNSLNLNTDELYRIE